MAACKPENRPVPLTYHSAVLKTTWRASCPQLCERSLFVTRQYSDSDVQSTLINSFPERGQGVLVQAAAASAVTSWSWCGPFTGR
ncbi:hypothetical protein HZ326_13820 [Fusarium oxysporum f. sp. albedinis]|nr:hypothetical protein HZ326_13820 [Fusarium oxysporum f. sp. albedinis]